MIQGQLNLILLLPIIGAWYADRTNRPKWAGLFLGIAAAIKIFPAFLFVYFVLRRNWKSVAVSLVSLTLITAVTALVLGVDTYRTYVEAILPTTVNWKGTWNNASLPGLWCKLFDPTNKTGEIMPLFHGQFLTCTATFASWGVVLAYLIRLVPRVRSRRDCDLAFGLSVTAMLLVSPVTLEHYFLLLLIPLAVVWTGLPSSRMASQPAPTTESTTALADRWRFHAIVVALFLPVIILCNLFIPGEFPNGSASPAYTLTVLSFQYYALMGLFYVTASSITRPPRSVNRLNRPAW